MKSAYLTAKSEMDQRTGFKKTFVEKTNFLTKFLQSPRNIGSVTPSSSYLARAVMEPIDWAKTGTIVELGAGTGVFTGLIKRLKYPECRGIIFEQDRELRKYLMNLYQGFSYHSRAEELDAVLRQLDLDEVDCILSGLPFMNFPPPLRDRILHQVMLALKPGGLFIQFQYSLHMKKQLAGRFRRVEHRFVPLNIPPAFVYYCYK